SLVVHSNSDILHVFHTTLRKRGVNASADVFLYPAQCAHPADDIGMRGRPVVAALSAIAQCCCGKQYNDLAAIIWSRSGSGADVYSGSVRSLRSRAVVL